MNEKTLFYKNEKLNVNGNGTLICSHSTRFLDQEFFNKCEDQTQSAKPVAISSINAEWILKTDQGTAFLNALCDTNNLNYYGVDSIVLLIQY